MKSYFFLSIICFVFSISPAFSSPTQVRSTSPAIDLPSAVAYDLLQKGDYLSSNGKLDCFVLLNKHWNYQNAQSMVLCLDTEVTCVRHGLIQQAIMRLQDKENIQTDYKGPSLDFLKQELSVSLEQLTQKLLGCVLAIEAAGQGNATLIEKAGFADSSSSGHISAGKKR